MQTVMGSASALTGFLLCVLSSSVFAQSDSGPIILQQLKNDDSPYISEKAYEWKSATCETTKEGLVMQLGEKGKDSSVRLTIKDSDLLKKREGKSKNLTEFEGTMEFVDRHSKTWLVREEILKGSKCTLTPFGPYETQEKTGINLVVKCEHLVPKDDKVPGNTNFEISNMYPLFCLLP